ncbi:MAG TPA: hypothetical protein PKJ33_00050 [Alphaproteobacteria bacterium]|nr:hypothetical protein [Alphaproteobacteria bacterium]
MYNKKKLKTFGKYSFVVLFALSVLLNVKQALDENLSKTKIDLLNKSLEDKNKIKNFGKQEFEKKLDGFDMDKTTDDIILKKLQSEKLNTR